MLKFRTDSGPVWMVQFDLWILKRQQFFNDICKSAEGLMGAGSRALVPF